MTVSTRATTTAKRKSLYFDCSNSQPSHGQMVPPLFSSKRVRRMLTITSSPSTSDDEDDNDEVDEDEHSSFRSSTEAPQTPVVTTSTSFPQHPPRLVRAQQPLVQQQHRSSSLESVLSDTTYLADQVLPKPKPRTWAPPRQQRRTCNERRTRDDSNSGGVAMSLLDGFLGAVRNGASPSEHEAEDLLRFSRLAGSLATVAQAAVMRANGSDVQTSPKHNRQLLPRSQTTQHQHYQLQQQQQQQQLQLQHRNQQQNEQQHQHQQHQNGQHDEQHQDETQLRFIDKPASPIEAGTWIPRNQTTTVAHAWKMLPPKPLDTSFDAGNENVRPHNQNGHDPEEHTEEEDDDGGHTPVAKRMCQAHLQSLLPRIKSSRKTRIAASAMQGRALIGSRAVVHSHRFPAPLTLASPRTVPLAVLRKAQRYGGQLDVQQLARAYASMAFDAMCVIECSAVRTDNLSEHTSASRSTGTASDLSESTNSCSSSNNRKRVALSPYKLAAIHEEPSTNDHAYPRHNGPRPADAGRRGTAQPDAGRRGTAQQAQGNTTTTETKKKKHVYMSLKAIQVEMLRANAPLAVLDRSFLDQALEHLKGRGLVRPHVTAQGIQYFRLVGTEELDKCSLEELRRRVSGQARPASDESGKGKGHGLSVVGVGEGAVRVTLDMDLNVLKAKWKHVASLSF